ncbi:hypothetical protein Enr13x_09300 [Stieleria neptunia]|uniref:Uncharacterized protein n=1 Tax=Stieleria neptunia TaxID=2527979 RepID=A0A518HJR9_9BACT|nr:hypothetical protein Enr13x_09300 [Stieleria neptunia]
MEPPKKTSTARKPISPYTRAVPQSPDFPFTNHANATAGIARAEIATDTDTRFRNQSEANSPTSKPIAPSPMRAIASAGQKSTGLRGGKRSASKRPTTIIAVGGSVRAIRAARLRVFMGSDQRNNQAGQSDNDTDHVVAAKDLPLQKTQLGDSRASAGSPLVFGYGWSTTVAYRSISFRARTTTPRSVTSPVLIHCR